MSELVTKEQVTENLQWLVENNLMQSVECIAFYEDSCTAHVLFVPNEPLEYIKSDISTEGRSEEEMKEFVQELKDWSKEEDIHVKSN